MRIHRLETACFVLALVLSHGCDRAAPVPTESAASAEPISVTIVVQIQDRPERSIEVDDLPAGATVAEAMKQVDELDIQIKGKGTMTFVESIEGLKPAGDEGWLYFINDAWAKQGVGAQRLSDGDVVRWRYGSLDAR